MTALHNDPAMGNSNFARISHDYYPTPAWMTQGLVDLFADFGGTDTPIRFDADWWNRHAVRDTSVRY